MGVVAVAGLLHIIPSMKTTINPVVVSTIRIAIKENNTRICCGIN
jgi:hypothetical protein